MCGYGFYYGRYLLKMLHILSEVFSAQAAGSGVTRRKGCPGGKIPLALLAHGRAAVLATNGVVGAASAGPLAHDIDYYRVLDEE